MFGCEWRVCRFTAFLFFIIMVLLIPIIVELTIGVINGRMIKEKYYIKRMFYV